MLLQLPADSHLVDAGTRRGLAQEEAVAQAVQLCHHPPPRAAHRLPLLEVAPRGVDAHEGEWGSAARGVRPQPAQRAGLAHEPLLERPVVPVPELILQDALVVPQGAELLVVLVDGDQRLGQTERLGQEVGDAVEDHRAHLDEAVVHGDRVEAQAPDEGQRNAPVRHVVRDQAEAVPGERRRVRLQGAVVDVYVVWQHRARLLKDAVGQVIP
mmetsp:Transcript_31564/g.93965  ORF Transcript_31564/g.93965 Transcript_31564/m.93965 type:complete len:212 (+) Transcript_31564:848-1483(+)